MKTSAEVRYLYSEKLSASGGEAFRSPDYRLCLWTPLEAQPLDPHFWGLRPRPSDQKLNIQYMHAGVCTLGRSSNIK